MQHLRSLPAATSAALRALATPAATTAVAALVTEPASRTFSSRLLPMLPSFFRAGHPLSTQRGNEASLLRDPFKEFDDFFRTGRLPLISLSMQGPQSGDMFFPHNFGHVDVMETEAAHIVKVDLPGMKKSDVRIQLDKDNVLTVSGERQRTEDKKEASYQLSERHFGRFSRSFRLPDDAREDSIAAEMKDGVLSISIPRMAPHEGQQGPREIAIADSVESAKAKSMDGSTDANTSSSMSGTSKGKHGSSNGEGSSGGGAARDTSGSEGEMGKEGVAGVCGAGMRGGVKEPVTSE